MLFGPCNYKIEGFRPRFEGGTFGRWNFSIGLKKEFANNCFNKELSEIVFNSMNRDAEIFSEKLGLMSDPPQKHYEFVRNGQGKRTFLLSSCNVPGINVHLALERMEFPRDLRIKHQYDEYLVYSPHNIDASLSASGLLSNWIRWYDCVEATLMDPID